MRMFLFPKSMAIFFMLHCIFSKAALRSVPQFNLPGFNRLEVPSGQAKLYCDTDSCWKVFNRPDDFETESGMLEKVRDCPHVIRILEKDYRTLSIKLKYYKKKDFLEKYLFVRNKYFKKFPTEPDKKVFGIEMLRLVKSLSNVEDGLKEIEQKEISHNDIKPENLFVNDDGSLDIADFGAATQFGQYPVIITEEYCPPERLTRQSDGSFDKWSIAQIIMRILTVTNSRNSISLELSKAVHEEDENKIVRLKNFIVDDWVSGYGEEFRETGAKLLDLLAQTGLVWNPSQRKWLDFDAINRVIDIYIEPVVATQSRTRVASALHGSLVPATVHVVPTAVPVGHAPATGGFGAGGFGAPAAGGFGAPAAGSFGAPAAGGFGTPAAGGFGLADAVAPTTPVGAVPTAGGFSLAALWENPKFMKQMTIFAKNFMEEQQLKQEKERKIEEMIKKGWA